jgi:hypothetical protein
MSASQPKHKKPMAFLNAEQIVPATLLRAEIERALIHAGPGGTGRVRMLDSEQVEVRTERGIGIINRGQLKTIIGEIDAASAERFRRAANVIGEQAAADLARRVTAEPPQLADLCLSLLLSSAKSEAIIGDLNESFLRDCLHFVADRAKRMYWGRTLRSLWPLMRRAAVRLIKWGVLIESVRRFF